MNPNMSSERSRPGLWLLKLVQCAVSGQADKIEIELHPTESRVVFANPSGIRADEVMGPRAGEGDPPPQTHLQVALQARLAQGEEQVTLRSGGQLLSLSRQVSPSRNARTTANCRFTSSTRRRVTMKRKPPRSATLPGRRPSLSPSTVRISLEVS